MPPASRAVFLSYASQDAAAARCIGESLRAGGIEVWLDQSELVGGDAWDAKIRAQIASCTLFVPVISAATQARREGYFRLEWKLAAQRTHMMSERSAFLLPVVIDDTRDAEADVPGEFRAVQWTRLPGSETPPAFVARVKELLSGLAASPAANGAASAPTPGATPRRRLRLFLQTTIAMGLLAAGIATWLARSPARAPVDDKSIAVLPFKNLSEDKDNNAFFATGVHEDILTNLAHIRALRVVSRTSVERFRDGKKSIREIGAELGVAWVLEGSVQRAGTKVHVTGQLINARTDEQVWAENYNRDLTDVFAVQAELATAIASALQAALSPQEKATIARRPTLNAAAYDFFLRGRESLNHDNPADGPMLDKQETLFQSAADLDPEFAEAWAELAVIHAVKVFWGRDQSAGRAARAKSAIERAVRLAPDAPDVIRLLGMYYYYSQRDYAHATEHFQKVIRLQPNDAKTYLSLGLVQRRQGRWGEALLSFRKATRLDPGNSYYAHVLASELSTGRRYDDAKAELRRLVAMAPDVSDIYELAKLDWLARGSTQEVEEFFSRFPPGEANSTRVLRLRLRWANERGDAPEIVRLDEILSRSDAGHLANERGAVDAAWALAARGDVESARIRLGDLPAKLRARLEKEPANASRWAALGAMEALLGNKDEARRCSAKAVELVPESLDSLDGPFWRSEQATVLAWTGEKERAITEFAHLLRAPCVSLNVYLMKNDFALVSLRADPRFQALLNDPKNNAPLF